MSVDYRGLGGVGIEFTEDMVDKAIEHGIFSIEDWEKDKNDVAPRAGAWIETCNGSGYYDNQGSPSNGSCGGTGKEKYKPGCIKTSAVPNSDTE